MSTAHSLSPTSNTAPKTDCDENFSMMIHNIRNRISALKLGVYMIEKQSPQELQARVHEIQEQIDSLTDIVQHLKDSNPCQQHC